jgi:hypothetical protein
MKVLREGIPGWAQKGYPIEGRRTGAIEHRPYPPEVLEFERRLAASRGSGGSLTTTPAAPGGPSP